MLEKILPGLAHLQNIHPLVVHFPIALFPAAALFYLSSSVFRNESLGTVAFWILLLGTLGAGLSVGTGLYAESGVMVSRSVRANLLEPHEQLMIATLSLSAVLSLWALIARPFPRRCRRLFLFLFLILIGVMTQGTDYGGRMVYDYNAGGNACPQPIEFGK